jgi:putative hydrolase of the HAD superfamily
MDIKVIAFDADDTLWVNEPYFQQTEAKFCALLEDYLPQHSLAQALFKTETKNLALYGYGVKGFMLSMIETALSVSNNTLNVTVIQKAIEYGKELLQKPIELLDGIEKVLQQLQPKYTLVVATKGDLLDQARKLKNSGIDHYFHHTEIMSDKQEVDYTKLVKRLNILPSQFLMIGNSLKSDVLPVLAIGGHAIHIPYHTTWAHEQIAYHVEHKNFTQVKVAEDILPLLL